MGRSQGPCRASSARNCYAPLGAPLPRIISGETGKETGTPSPDKTRAGGALSCSVVIAGLDPAIHLFAKRWTRGSSPRVTKERKRGCLKL